MAPRSKLIRICRNSGLAAALSLTAACDTAIPILVGNPHAGQNTSAPLQPPSAALPTTSSGIDPLGKLDRLTVAPPTIPANPDAMPIEAAPAPRPPHSALAVVPLATDPDALSPLATAAAHAAATSKDARFVLMILSPPAASAAVLAHSNTDAQAAADAAVKALGKAGIASDQVAVSAVTSPTLTSAEIRLYQR